MKTDLKNRLRAGLGPARLACLVLASGAGALLLAPATAGELAGQSAFQAGPLYAGAPPAAPNQAQVIVYRGTAANAQGRSANVYVDKQLHTALQADSYSRFCVEPGEHSIEGYFNDAPLFDGKRHPRTRVELAAGTTYFVELNEAGGDLAPRAREAAEAKLRAAREQVHLLSRAGAAQVCQGDVAMVAAPLAATAAPVTATAVTAVEMPAASQAGKAP